MALKERGRPALTGVASADRVLTVLTAFRRGDRALGLAELADRTGLVKSTIMRLAISLEAFGLIVRLGDGRYQLAGEIKRLNSIYEEGLQLEAHVMPILQRLRDQTGETASFYIRHGAYRMCLYRVNSEHQVRVHIQPGDMRPMDSASSAIVLQAFEDPDARAADVVPPVYSCGTTDPHAASLSVPVFEAGLTLAGAIVISGPANRFSKNVAEAARPQVIAAATDLTRSLGGAEAASHLAAILEGRPTARARAHAS